MRDGRPARPVPAVGAESLGVHMWQAVASHTRILRHVVGLHVVGDDALETFDLAPRADHRDEVRAGRMAHDDDLLAVAAVALDVALYPADAVLDLQDLLADIDLRHGTVGQRDEHPAATAGEARQVVDLGPVAFDPATPVDVDDHRHLRAAEQLAFVGDGRGMNVELQPLADRNAGMEPIGLREGRQRREEGDEKQDDTHGRCFGGSDRRRHHP